MNKEYIVLNARVSVENTRFLLTTNNKAKELYILHREYPRCLIFVEQTTPINFIVVDFFEPSDKQEDAIKILTSESFKSDLKEYFKDQYTDTENFN